MSGAKIVRLVRIHILNIEMISKDSSKTRKIICIIKKIDNRDIQVCKNE